MSGDPFAEMPGASPAPVPDPFSVEAFERAGVLMRESRLSGRDRARAHLDGLKAEAEARAEAEAARVVAESREAAGRSEPVGEEPPAVFDWGSFVVDEAKPLDVLLDEIAAEDEA